MGDSWKEFRDDRIILQKRRGNAGGRLSRFAGNLLVIVGVVIFVLLVATYQFGRGLFVSEDTAIKALETQGFSNITIESHDWLAIGWRGGSKDDVARFTAHATNPAGKRVEVYVYAGWPFKGATVRSP